MGKKNHTKVDDDTLEGQDGLKTWVDGPFDNDYENEDEDFGNEELEDLDSDDYENDEEESIEDYEVDDYLSKAAFEDIPDWEED